MTFLKSVLPKCYILKNIYLFLCLKVIFDILGSFWLKNNSNFGKVQFCPELSNFIRFYPILATGEDFSTIVWRLYKPCGIQTNFQTDDTHVTLQNRIFDYMIFHYRNVNIKIGQLTTYILEDTLILAFQVIMIMLNRITK